MLILLGLALAGPLEAHWKIPASVKTWRVIRTDHYTIHYPEGYPEMGLRAALYAEEAAARYERVLQHRLTQVIPVFLYASHQDFSATNILPIPIDEGTGGFTDFYRRRVVVPFHGDYAALRHVLAHEVAHAFQFDILGDEDYGRYPLWLMEGMAEYLSLGWDQSAEEFTRDLVLHDRMPRLADLHAGRVRGYAYYKGGQAVMLFMATLRGEERIAFFLKEVRHLRDLRLAIQSSFDRSPEEFDLEFGQFLRARYAGAMNAAPRARDERLRAVTNRYEDWIGLNLHPVLSPDGKRIAYLTVDGVFPAVVVRPAPGPTVSAERLADVKIVLRALRDRDYEEWQPLTTRLSFTPDGKKIIVAGRRAGRQALLVIDLNGGRVIHSLEPPFDAIQYPSLEPGGRRVVFTGVVRGAADLYAIHLVTGTLERFTNDFCYETTPRFAPDSRALYFASNCASEDNGEKDPGRAAGDPGRPGRDLYRLDLEGGQGRPVRLTRLGGSSSDPLPARDGSLVFRSDFSGVSNLYRLENAAGVRAPRAEQDLVALTASPTGVFQPSAGQDQAGGELLTFTELNEGAYEIRVLPAGSAPAPGAYARIGPMPLLPGPERTFLPAEYRFPTDDTALRGPFIPGELDEPYHGALGPEGRPFVILTAGTNSRGETGLAALAFGSFADETGDHRVQGFVSALGSPPEVDADLRYLFTRYRTDFFAGAYHHSGVFAVFNPLDFSLNNVLYNPYFRLLSQRSSAAYAGAEYALHRYGSVSAVVEQGREERIFRPRLPEEREQDDLYENFSATSVAYRFDNAVYTIFGPLDGHAFTASYSVPLRGTGTERELYLIATEYRFYHLFSDFSTFALRLFAGGAGGADATNYPFRLGGYYTLRGYDFLEFEGRYAVLANIEYRFNFIEQIHFGFPGRWSAGTIRGVLFADAGSAFDYPDAYQAVDPQTGRTRDLHASYGFGLHWLNFLWPFLPGAVMKVEWATPYDGKQSLPVNKWRGQFSLGFNF